MVRKIIKIDKERCNGCGLCCEACHEGAIGMADGKAKLLRDDYCDGLGDCLPVCPTGAITFEEREAAEYDEAAVKERMANMEKKPPAGGCPGSNAHAIKRDAGASVTLPCGCPGSNAKTLEHPEGSAAPEDAPQVSSQLAQWPVQIKLVPVNAPYFEGANLLVAADCAAYAYGNFHSEYMRGKVTIIGCPKLDEGDYSEKLAEIIRQNNIQSVTVVRMEVPCCGGIEHAVKAALLNSGKMIPWQVVTISTNGSILDN